MAQKNETLSLVAALLVTAGVIGGGLWWFNRDQGIDIGGIFPGTSGDPTISDQNPPPSTGSTFADVDNIPSGLFNYGGSTSWAPLRLTVDPGIQAARPEFRLRYVDPASGAASSSKGIEMLIDGKLAFAQSSRPLEDAEFERAQQRGFSLQQVPVAIDGLAVAVNPSLEISGLTLTQLQQIYTGQITNWQQIGGANISITPYSRPVNSGGTVDLFREDILGGQDFGQNVQFVNTTTEALRALANAPGGIYYASAPEVVPQCTVKPVPVGRQPEQFVAPYSGSYIRESQCPQQRNTLNIEAFRSGDYPLTRSLYVIVKQNGQIEEQAGNAYANLLLTNQGQELMSQSGFVRLR
jgi:phosphate transport system substrate-binding protein